MYEFKAAYGYKAESFIKGREYITEVLRELCNSEGLIQGQIGRITELEKARNSYLNFVKL